MNDKHDTTYGNTHRESRGIPRLDQRCIFKLKPTAEMSALPKFHSVIMRGINATITREHCTAAPRIRRGRGLSWEGGRTGTRSGRTAHQKFIAWERRNPRPRSALSEPNRTCRRGAAPTSDGKTHHTAQRRAEPQWARGLPHVSSPRHQHFPNHSQSSAWKGLSEVMQQPKFSHKQGSSVKYHNGPNTGVSTLGDSKLLMCLRSEVKLDDSHHRAIYQNVDASLTRDRKACIKTENCEF